MTTTQNLDPVLPANASSHDERADAAGTRSSHALALGAPTSANVPAAPAPPSVHVRALLTWIAIFPLVAIGLTVLAPIAGAWPPVLRAFALTIVIVPAAVYVIVPQLLKLYGRIQRRRAARERE